MLSVLSVLTPSNMLSVLSVLTPSNVLTPLSISCVYLVRLFCSSLLILPPEQFERFDPFELFRIFRAFDSYNYLSNSSGSSYSKCFTSYALRRVKINFFKQRESPSGSKCLTRLKCSECTEELECTECTERLKGFEVFGVNTHITP